MSRHAPNSPSHTLRLVRPADGLERDRADDPSQSPSLVPAAHASPLRSTIPGRSAQTALRHVEQSASPTALTDQSIFGRSAATELHTSIARTRAEQARASVIRANAAASAMSALDARWMLAQAVSANLELGTVAALQPEKRARLVAHAAALGLRPFDANLVIAIVQDQARQGRSLDRDAAERLSMISPAHSRGGTARAESDELLRLLVIAAGLGMIILSVLIAWVRA